MAYDPVKAHEYYLKYRKKGLKKGRKKGTKQKQTALLGVSASGLNSNGSIEASLIKERAKKEMNAALSKAKTDEEKLSIRKQYAQKANDEIAKLKADPKYAKAKTSKTSSSKTGSNKSGSSKGTSSKSGGSSKSTKGYTVTKSTKKSQSKKSANKERLAEQISQIKGIVTELISALSSDTSNITEEQKTTIKLSIQEQITALRKRLANDKVN